jgi:hypothetical protein
MVGKTLDRRHFDNPNEDLQAFMAATASVDKNGEPLIDVRDPNEYILFSFGMNSYSLHMARVAQIRERAGKTPGEVLMNFGVKEELAQERDNWNAFLDWSDGETARLGYKNSLRSMIDAYNQYKAIRRGDKVSITLDQQRLIDFDQSMRNYARFFDYNPETAGKYAKMRGAAYDALFESIGAPSELSKGISWWYDNVADPYYTKLDKLYGQLDTSHDQGLIYTQIRKLTDSYNRVWSNPEFEGTFPSPEEYVFAKKTPKEQTQAIAHWAYLPGDYLTEFQREQVGYDIPKDKQAEVTRWANLYARMNHSLDVYEEQHGITSSMTAHDDNLALRDRFAAEKAAELGISDVVKQFNAPAYVRVGNALDLGQRTERWGAIRDDVSFVESNLAQARSGDGVSAAGNTVEAVKMREVFAARVEWYRKKDPALDTALTEIAASIGETNHDKFYDKFFFDVFVP